jgi:hypothetical protein
MNTAVIYFPEKNKYVRTYVYEVPRQNVRRPFVPTDVLSDGRFVATGVLSPRTFCPHRRFVHGRFVSGGFVSGRFVWAPYMNHPRKKKRGRDVSIHTVVLNSTCTFCWLSEPAAAQPECGEATLSRVASMPSKSLLTLKQESVGVN